MELRRLRYFLRIAAEGSLGKASRAIGIAQPALSRQMQLLESEIGVILFRRVAKGMVLTEEGAYLKEALEHPLQQVDMALHNVRSYSTRVEAALILGLPPVVSELLGARLIRRLRDAMPNLGLRIVEAGSSRLASEISQGLVDIALLVDVTPDSRAFHSEIMTEQLMLVAPPELLMGLVPEASRPLALKDLEDLPFVLPPPGSTLRTRLAKAAAGAESTIKVVLEVDSPALAKQVTIQGAGYTLLPPVAFKAEAAQELLQGRAVTGLEQSVFWAVQPNWRVPRSTYNMVENVIYRELYDAASSGEWPANWTLDLARLSMPLTS